MRTKVSRIKAVTSFPTLKTNRILIFSTVPCKEAFLSSSFPLVWEITLFPQLTAVNPISIMGVDLASWVSQQPWGDLDNELFLQPEWCTGAACWEREPVVLAHLLAASSLLYVCYNILFSPVFGSVIEELLYYNSNSQWIDWDGWYWWLVCVQYESLASAAFHYVSAMRSIFVSQANGLAGAPARQVSSRSWWQPASCGKDFYNDYLGWWCMGFVTLLIVDLVRCLLSLFEHEFCSASGPIWAASRLNSGVALPNNFS